MIHKTILYNIEYTDAGIYVIFAVLRYIYSYTYVRTANPSRRKMEGWAQLSQARSKQNLSGQAKDLILRQRGVAMQHLARGVWGHAPPRKILKCTVSQVASGGF